MTADLTSPPWYPLDLEDEASDDADWAAALREVPGVITASVLRPSTEGPVEAVMTMSVSSPPKGVSLEEFVSVHLGGAAYELTEEHLRVGRALRAHRAGTAGADETSVEAVGYAFRAPDGAVVWQEVFWPGTGEHRWCDTADTVARGLSFT